MLRSILDTVPDFVIKLSPDGIIHFSNRVAPGLDLAEVAERIPRIRAGVGLPVGVGFGIRDAESARRIAAVADAVVIGSRIIEEIERSPQPEIAARVSVFLRGIRQAMDNAEVSVGVSS